MKIKKLAIIFIIGWILAGISARSYAEHSVFGAVWRSAVLPGWGQFYNRQKTKDAASKEQCPHDRYIVRPVVDIVEKLYRGDVSKRFNHNLSLGKSDLTMKYELVKNISPAEFENTKWKRINGWKIAAEGVAGFAVGYAVGCWAFYTTGMGVIIYYPLQTMLATSVAVYGTGAIIEGRWKVKRFIYTLLGSSIGTIAGVTGGLWAAKETRGSSLWWAPFITFHLLQSAGATLGFNLSKPREQIGLINFNGKTFNVSLPEIFLSRRSLEDESRIDVRLLRVDF